jgi:hypothetical protein
MMSQKGDETIRITEMTPRESVPGVWVSGWIYGYYFNALVFNDHAKEPSWEIGKSRISKLWIQRPRDRRVMYNWDRGLDVPPAGNLSQAAVGYLAEHLADLVFGTNSSTPTGKGGDRIRFGKLGRWIHSQIERERERQRFYYANMPRWLRRYSFNRKLYRRRCWNRRMKATFRG